ncbi:cell shape determination protein CcmA [Natronococcus pandeyae]|uniref:Cell shape determination protein CcmA n=1 Tax=Natronococcus pandeyae TaxID=2055836 RepID=A0A8J8Q6T8_9EURY|nr:polymer-forming cytoskeletal protein [Natronococcus pandeyae]TYL39673.1 cell shape determination protein CcmA [Natronococcus pandeyae]
MGFRTSIGARVAIALLVVVLLGTMPASVAAQSDERAGGTIVVEEGETVDEVEAFAGNVIVRGTVTGDVSAFAGNVQIDGEVGGDVEAVSGNVEITGTVDGDVSGAGGNFVVAEDATIGGSLEAGAGTVEIDGTIAGDAAIGAETIRLGENAAIDGDLRYGGTLEGNTDAVAGEITEDSRIGVGLEPTVQPFAEWLFAVYAFVLNLLLGAILLALFPRFSDGVARRVATDPVRTGLAGLGVLVGVPILLVAIAITIIGIPVTVVGAFLFALLVWIGVVYGRFAVAAWLLSYADLENRWLALVVGLLGGALLGQIPFVGGLLNFVIFLLGLGALSMGLYGHRRVIQERERDRPSGVEPGGPASD